MTTIKKNNETMALQTGISSVIALLTIILLFIAGCSKDTKEIKDNNEIKEITKKYDSGQLKEKFEGRINPKGIYIKHGIYVSWYENRQKKQEGEFKDGKESGKHIFWYDNGQKESEGEFENGKKIRTWIYWDKDGHKKI